MKPKLLSYASLRERKWAWGTYLLIMTVATITTCGPVLEGGSRLYGCYVTVRDARAARGPR